MIERDPGKGVLSLVKDVYGCFQACPCDLETEEIVMHGASLRPPAGRGVLVIAAVAASTRVGAREGPPLEEVVRPPVGSKRIDANRGRLVGPTSRRDHLGAAMLPPNRASN